MFRKITYPKNLSHLPGQIYLHSMPGRDETWLDFTTMCEQQSIGNVLCLTSELEIGLKSPQYAQRLITQALPVELEIFAIEDFSIPENIDDFQRALKRVAQRLETETLEAQNLKAQHNLLIHCAAGIGRTGCAAICLLSELGLEVEAAIALVKAAGSGPETPQQLRFVKNYPV